MIKAAITSIIIVILTGCLGCYLDIRGVDIHPLYWMIGAFGGFISGVIAGNAC